MNIFTLYTKSAFNMMLVLDMMVLKGSVKVLAADPAKLYNDSNNHDVSLAAVTIETHELRGDVELAANMVCDDPVYVCDENPEDWK